MSRRDVESQVESLEKYRTFEGDLKGEVESLERRKSSKCQDI